ncbi:hypothetical protein [Arthrobacter sp. YD2]|uniref:hypothetical protein n=1 Tax=Arthrobacter sp. YD2 TaxID=3058046 RepID=UPI0025B2E6B3|nr:hypothetical protein [Arthrobacter sp. YD2]MDN3905805.1 hypothetical protein [Arthrobacter sp. YD2]
MRISAISPVLALLLLTGCGAATVGAEAKPPLPSASAEPSVETGAADTEEQSCLKLLGTDGQGPLTRVVSVVKIGDGTTGVEMGAEEARPLHDEVLAIAKEAPVEIAPLVKELSSPTENVLRKAENPDASWNLNADTWTTAVTELQTRCEPYEPVS